MAITSAGYLIFSKLRNLGLVPPNPSILEFGESEWYGDVSTAQLSDSIDSLVADEAVREQYHQSLVDILCSQADTHNWDLAKLFYKIFLNYSKLTAIDFHGTSEALKLDLNYPIALGEQFDILVNGGTAEHVFNVFQFFKTSHEVVKPGGLMLHTMPFRGWLDHGFYSFNPTFYWDLAHANGYAMVMLAYTELFPARIIFVTQREQVVELARSGGLGSDALLFAVMKKAEAESGFEIPVQGYYAGTIGEEMTNAWSELQRPPA
jgi:hypothetical protein